MKSSHQRDHWGKKIAGVIDYQNLCLFDWGQNEFLDQKSTERLALVDKLLDSNSEMFERGDYKTLAMLVRVFLTGDITISDSLSPSRPIMLDSCKRESTM